MSQQQPAPENLSTPEPASPQPKPEEQFFFVARTQEDFNKKAGDLRSEGRQAATNALLKDLGLDSVDALKNTVSEYRTIQQATESDVERLQRELKEREDALSVLKGERDGFEGNWSTAKERADRYEAALKQRLEAEMEGVPDYIKAVIEDRDPLDQLAYITEHREAFASQPDRPAGVGSTGSRDESPQSVWDMPDHEFQQMQQRVANGERVVPPRT